MLFRILPLDDAKPAGKKFKPTIEPPYRWRDWTAKSGGITGDELLAFINDEEAVLPNGKRGTDDFLVEAYKHLAKQVQTVADRRFLQEESLSGYVPKPALLGQMNLLLH